jgi:hypothetical protein
VEAKKRQVELIDYQVLVVAGIADQGCRLRVAGDIEAQPAIHAWRSDRPRHPSVHLAGPAR